MTNMQIHYSISVLKNTIKNNNDEIEKIPKNKNMSNIKLIASILRNENHKQNNSGKTKEQLYAMGFTAGEIHQFFNYTKGPENTHRYYWYLKSNLKINNKKIRNCNDLIQAIRYEKYRIAG